MSTPTQNTPTFDVGSNYKPLRDLGRGAYGHVISAYDESRKGNVAIKKISHLFEKSLIAKRTLRELKLLTHFKGHDNIISIIDIMKPMSSLGTGSFEEVFVIQELMEADLHQIIKSKQALSEAHHQFFLYQILRGLKYIHSANVLHRDLKPGNLLVNSDCELKICDFGLARGLQEKIDDNTGFMTEYVATRWYRAPEIMLSYKGYSKAIDIWSVGCIFAELLGGRPLFPGRDYVHQLNLILQVVGTPSEEVISRIGSSRAQAYVRSLPRMPKVAFSAIYPKASPAAIDLLNRLLEFDPHVRITVEQALQHPFLAEYHDETDEPTIGLFDFSFESAQEIPEIRDLISREIESFPRDIQPALGDDNNDDDNNDDDQYLKPKLDHAREYSPRPTGRDSEVIIAQNSSSSQPPEPEEMDIVDPELEMELANGGAM